MTVVKHRGTRTDLDSGDVVVEIFHEQCIEDATSWFHDECADLGVEPSESVYRNDKGMWCLTKNGVLLQLEFDVDCELEPADTFIDWLLDKVEFRLLTPECPVCACAPNRVCENMLCMSNIRVDLCGNVQYTGDTEILEHELTLLLKDGECTLQCCSCGAYWQSSMTENAQDKYIDNQDS